MTRQRERSTARLDKTRLLRFRAPHLVGQCPAHLACAAGVHPTTIRALVRGDTCTVRPQLHDTIAAVHDAGRDKHAPARTRFGRGAATATRKPAMTGTRCAAALDDGLLSSPGYQTAGAGNPATGTGTVPDIDPRVLQQKEGVCPTTNA